jgi:hypothetical protein
MQSENGILLLFYRFLRHGNEKKKEKKRKGVGCKKGGCCVLSTSTCDIFIVFRADSIPKPKTFNFTRRVSE